MHSKIVTVKAPSGLHARPASIFVGTAGKFKNTKITVGRAEQSGDVNAKSIVMVLSLSIEQGDAIRICASGEQEQEAAATLAALVDRDFIA